MAKKKSKMNVEKFLTQSFGYASGAYTGAQAQTFAEQQFLPEVAIPWSGAVPTVLGGSVAWFAPSQWKTIGWGALAYGGFSLLNQVVLMLTESGGGTNGQDTNTQGGIRSNRNTKVGMRIRPRGNSGYESDSGKRVRR